MKKLLILFFAVAMLITAAGCQTQNNGTDSVSNETQTVSLEGSWKQVNEESETSYQKAEIKDGTIEIYWVFEENNTEALYWAGTYEEPINNKAYSWNSTNDKEKTGSALMASGDDTKTFTYKDDVISYEVSAMGMTSTVKLKRQTD